MLRPVGFLREQVQKNTESYDLAAGTSSWRLSESQWCISVFLLDLELDG